jgi:glycosyltransferase involved in cell wall biosynthesis
MFMIKHIPKKLGILLAKEFFKKFKKRHISVPLDSKSLSINLVTSWDKQCGIATYSAFLAEELKKNVHLYITVLPKKNALSLYFFIQGYEVARSQDLVHVQFEYGIFPRLRVGRRNLTAFAALLFYFGLTFGNRHIITTIHEPRKKVTSGGKSGLYYTKLLDKLIFTVSDLMIVHTQESKEIMKTIYGVSESKLRVIPHGSFEKPNFLNKEECKRKLGLQNKTVITILGFVTPKKGHDLVIPLLPQLIPNVQLVIAGGSQTTNDAAYLEELKKIVLQCHCSDKVTFTGFLQDLTCVLSATDIAILPYRTVTDSGVLHLLIAYRVPTIASNLRAFREVYDEFGCLELFNSEDPRDLFEKIQVLLSNQQLRDLLKAKCDDMWNATKWSNIAQRHVEVYREVLSFPSKDS